MLKEDLHKLYISILIRNSGQSKVHLTQINDKTQSFMQ